AKSLSAICTWPCRCIEPPTTPEDGNPARGWLSPRARGSHPPRPSSSGQEDPRERATTAEGMRQPTRKLRVRAGAPAGYALGRQRSAEIFHDGEPGAAPVRAVAKAVLVDEDVGRVQHNRPVRPRVDELLRGGRHAGADFERPEGIGDVVDPDA